MANISSMILERLNGGAPTLSPAASLYAKDKEDEEKKKNRGGLLGGLGYIGEKLGLGFLQGIEGIWDYTVGGIADLFGADEWAERRFSSDWLNYNHADEWYNPGEGWKFAGDITGGMGTSLPGILTAAGITLATGGTALPALAGIGVGSLSAAGTSTKEAMQESGELTGREYLYGAGMGAVEAVTEKLSGGLGAGVTKAAKSVGKAFGKVAAKETAEAAAKSAAKKGVAFSLKTAAKQAGKEFIGEAFEEGFAEFVAPYIARATYDPKAENATVQEIFYSALVGGLAGVGMGGATGALTQAKNAFSGHDIVKNGRTRQIMDLAKTYVEDAEAQTDAAVGIREIYKKLAPSVESGAELNKEQKRMLGELAAYETADQLRPMVQRSAIGAIQSADAVAERLNAEGRYKMVDGKLTDMQNTEVSEGAEVREITAEDIRGKYDPKNKKSLAKELKTNDVLRFIAASDAAGRLMMSAAEVENTVLTGTRIHSQAELNEFITSATAEQKASVGKELGIEDWNTLTVEEFAKKASAYRESGKAEAYKKKSEKIKRMQSLAESKPRSIPRFIALADGAVQNYADADNRFAVAREGDQFIIYDYDTGNVTRDMTRAEVNAALGRYRQSKAASEISAEVNQENEKTSENLSSDTSFSDEKIRENAKEVLKMDSVADLTGKEFSSQEPGTLKEKVLAFFASFGNKVKTKEIGIVSVNSASFHDDRSHGLTREKIVSFGAIQKVLASGKVIDIYKPDGKQYQRITIAAPIKIGTEKYYMGAMVQKDNQSNRMYLHEVITEKATLSFTTEPATENGEVLRDKGRLYITSILQNALKVNTSGEKSAKTLSEMLPMEEKARPTIKEIKAANEARAQAAAIESLAKEKIKGYADLSKPNQSMVRKVLREAMASGISEKDALSYARVSARSGLDIVFDKKACYKGKNEAGEDVYHAGFYDPEGNRIVINPETKRKHAALLIHELSHAIRSYIGKDGKRHYKAGIDDVTKISDEMWDKINADYGDGTISETQTEFRIDEASAYYAEKMLGTDTAIDLLLGEKPTLQQKILSFFKKSAQDYSSDEALSRESRKLLRNFKKTFDAFAARNQGRNIEARNDGDVNARRYSSDFVEFIDSVRKMKRKDIAGKRKFEIAEISESHAEIIQNVIKKELGKSINLKGYKLVINGDAVLHIEERHGANGTADHSMATNEDLASIGWAVNNAESGEVARKQNGNIDYSYVYKNSDNSAAPKILMKTKLSDNETFVITECVPDSEKKQIHILRLLLFPNPHFLAI